MSGVNCNANRDTDHCKIRRSVLIHLIHASLRSSCNRLWSLRRTDGNREHLERADDDNRLLCCCVDAQLYLSLDLKLPSHLHDL